MPWRPVLHLDLPDWIWAAPRAPPHTVAASSRTASPEPPTVIVASSSSSSSHAARTSTTGVRNTSPPSPPLCRTRVPAPARGHHRPTRLPLLWTPRPTLTVASPRTVASLPAPGSRTYAPCTSRAMPRRLPCAHAMAAPWPPPAATLPPPCSPAAAALLNLRKDLLAAARPLRPRPARRAAGPRPRPHPRRLLPSASRLPPPPCRTPPLGPLDACHAAAARRWRPVASPRRTSCGQALA
nr:atherin-like [Aegilops tauschii subsp. strangulata]